MARKSNTVSNSNQTILGSSIANNHIATFNVSSSLGDNAITVGPDGYCVINKLALLDDITGKKWEVKISNGEIIVEPIELEDKRDFKINKVLKND